LTSEPRKQNAQMSEKGAKQLFSSETKEDREIAAGWPLQ
jgi:hypothetical protein